jgi:hypothetical protein
MSSLRVNVDEARDRTQILRGDVVYAKPTPEDLGGDPGFLVEVRLSELSLDEPQGFLLSGDKMFPFKMGFVNRECDAQTNTPSIASTKEAKS